MEKLLKPSWFGLKKGLANSVTITPLVEAAKEGKIKAVELLIRYGAEINQKSGVGGDTPLLIACGNGYLQVAELLLRNGADVNYTNSWGETPLAVSVLKKNTEMVDLLLSYQPSLNTPIRTVRDSHTESTLLILAAQVGSKEIVKTLIDNGIKIDEKKYEGKTALLIASEKGNAEIVDLLIKAGANCTIKDNNNDVALQLAIQNACNAKNYLQTVKLLVANEYDINKPYHSRDLPVKQALRLGNTEIAEWLIANGAIISQDEKHRLEMERKQEEELLRLGYFCKTCGCYKNEKEVEEYDYEQDEWITIYYLCCSVCGGKITDEKGNWRISRVRN